MPHYFNYDPEKERYIDVTAGQFHGSNPGILVMPKDDPRVGMGWQESKCSRTHYIDQMFVMRTEKGILLAQEAPIKLKPKDVEVKSLETFNLF